MHLKYCMYAAHKVGKHPQTAMKDLGITYQQATPQSMADQWWFWNCEDTPKELPDYLTEMKLDPMECIGYGLGRETAERIRDYETDV